MRILHVVKTSDGAEWAARQARVLASLGVEVHVALPTFTGQAVPLWRNAKATLHKIDLSLPVRSPHLVIERSGAARQLVQEIQPDLIHSHFVTTTCLLRLALGKNHSIPRVFQVAGPLHLEHVVPRTFEIALAGKSDYWIGSSKFITDYYDRLGIAPERIFLSYYGWFDKDENLQTSRGELRKMVGASDSDRVIGNINFMYPPKYFLGQTVGLKCHEDIIDALGIVISRRPEVMGVFVGGVWGNARWYEESLRKRAHTAAGERIRFTGPLDFRKARTMWSDFDVGVHVPLSENCGGVPEPLASGIPVIAGNVGGLPEVVINGKTGWLVPPRQPQALADTIEDVLVDLTYGRRLASNGRQLVRTMFDADRVGQEVLDIYNHILGNSTGSPTHFDSRTFVDSLNGVYA